MRLIDANIFIFFAKVGALEDLLKLSGLAITSSVLRRELAPGSVARLGVEQALAEKQIALVDMDLQPEGTLFEVFYRGQGFGEGESTCMAICLNRGLGFYTYDLDALHKARSLGVDARSWQDLVDELLEAHHVSSRRAKRLRWQIESLMR